MQRYGEGVPRDHSGDYTLRPFNNRDFEGELERIREVFNDAFSENWHFLPLGREEYLFAAKYMNLVTTPDLVFLVEHRGSPVGVLECVPDINPLLKRLNGRIGPVKYLRYQRGRRKLQTLLIYAVGIKKAYQGTRVYKMLLDALIHVAGRYQILETTWMSPGNFLALRAAGHVGLEYDKEFVIYRKEIGSSGRIIMTGL
jgi:hypothetical protein